MFTTDSYLPAPNQKQKRQSFGKRSALGVDWTVCETMPTFFTFGTVKQFFQQQSESDLNVGKYACKFEIISSTGPSNDASQQIYHCQIFYERVTIVYVWVYKCLPFLYHG